MKTRLRNISILDMRHATKESIEQIESIGNVALIMVSRETKDLVAQLSISNVSKVLVLPDSISEPVMINGVYTLSTEAAQNPVFLLINGTLSVAEDTPPQAITEKVLGGMVNGTLTASEGQMAALMGAGVQVNGASTVYPDGCRLRKGGDPLSKHEAAGTEKPLYLTDQAYIEPGAAAAVLERGMKLYGGNGVVIDDAEAEAFFAVWAGSGKVIRLPQGYVLTRGTLSIHGKDRHLLRGSRYITGDLFLFEDVTAEALKKVGKLHVEGKLYVPEAVLDDVLDLLVNEPELVPYQGKLMLLNDVSTIDERLIAQTQGQLAILSDGVLLIEEDVSPDSLKDKVSLLINNGVLKLGREQKAALAPVLINDGHVEVREEQVEDGEPAEEEDLSDIRVLGNAATFVL